MPASRFVLAVDGGGTKTAARLVRDGATLAEATAGPCNLFQDSEGGLAAVRTACDEACARAGVSLATVAPEARLGAGLAGITAEGAVAAARRALASFASVALATDGYIALVGALRGASGALLSIGTGVIGYRLHTDGSVRRLGGWGFPVGDRGGGAWLGRRLLEDALETFDGHGAVAVGDEVRWAAEGWLGASRGRRLSRLRAARPADYGALAPAIVQAAERGDAYAQALLDEASRHLARLAQALEPSAREPLVVRGGLAAVMVPRLVAAGLAPAAIARDRDGTPLDGAVLIAAGEAPAEFPDGAGEGA